MTCPTSVRSLMVAVLAGLSAACGFDTGLGPASDCASNLFPSANCPGPRSFPPSIGISPSEDIGIAVGETLSLTATYRVNTVPVSDAAFEWRSANTAVATVGQDGVVRAVSVGSVYIVAGALGVRDSVVVHVRPPALVFTDLSVGSRQCGIAVGGTAYCWTTSPVPVPGGHSFTALSSGFYRHSCALESGGAYCWGEGDYGELGTTPGTSSTLPIAVSGGLTFTTVGTGTQLSCGLTSQGAAYCWGRNDYGQFGTGSTSGPMRCAGGLSCSPSPIRAADGMTFRSLVVGAMHVCGLVANGTVYCWGTNVYGTLGNGTKTDSPRPVAVAGGLTFASISSGPAHTCGVTTDGAGYCWGWNTMGQLGTPISTSEICPNGTCSTRPVRVAGERVFTSVSAGSGQSCGIDSAGVAFCWGSYFRGNVNYTDTPLPIADGLRFRTVSVGDTNACGITTKQVVYCWRTADFLRADSIVAVRVPGQA